MKKLIQAEEGSEPDFGFTPPEVLEGDSPTFKSVIWSLGVMIYYLATFKVPYEDCNKYALLEKMETGERGPLPDGFSPDITALLGSLL